MRTKLAGAPVGLVIVDLAANNSDVATIIEVAAEAEPTPAVVAFGPHVHEGKLAAARQAGCAEVLSRGEMHRQAGAVFQRYLGDAE